MNISSAFNRFYHKAVLVEMFEKAGQLKFHPWVDTETGEVLIFTKGVNFNDMEDLKQILKAMNLDYPNDDDNKMSTKKIDNVALMRHINWTIRVAGLNNIEFRFVQDEWDALLREAGIRH